ncbi:MAG TPA: SBBP repeat-containing protein [Bryobacteraceae bacterium]|nr:SBBP repeat-containing protein [Bryobacteraceae bacterium]
MRATPVLLFLARSVIAANQPTFTYAIPANTTVAAMTVDAAGNTYLTGSTTSSSFPATAGALQTLFSGGTCGTLPAFHGGLLTFPCADAFVIKLDPAGNVVFATYFGGNGNETVASAICVDASGNVYLGGLTGPNTVGQPATFPVTPGAAFTNLAGGGFVAKLNSSGTALVYSTLLPVNPPPIGRRAVVMAIDTAGEVYIASTNTGTSPFPTTPGAFQSTPPAFPDGSGVVAKLNASGSALLYATYLSGNGLTIPQGIAIDAAGDAFVAGFTQAADFPVTPGAFQSGYFASAQYMEFVTKLNPNGTGLVYSTFLGATLNYVSDIKVDAQGGAYVSAQGGGELSFGGYLSHLSADGSALLYSTYVPTVTAMDLALDSAGSAFVAGASGMAVLTPSPGAFQSGLVGVTGNVIAAKFTSDGQFAGGTYAYVAPAAGAGPLIALAPSGAIILAEGAPEMTVISIFPWLTAQNAASGAASTVAPGEIVTLRGYGLGPATAAVAADQAPAYQLGGTQVTFGGIAAPVFSAQSQQVTVQVPWEIAGQTSTEAVVTYNGGPPAGASASAPVVVATAAPGIFAVTNSDGTLNSPSNPAKVGGFITIYGTGGGVTNPLGITGGLWSITASLPTLTLPVSVTIGGTNAMVLYAGSAPTLESGYFQINVALPSGLQASAAVNLVVTVGGSSSVAVPISIQ